ncbi:MAG: A/G-specific adenine glycosylase [Bacteroidetes bacterium]|nr:A/G-specific adenine glycosylase [Bacteroidota bacterium]
MMLELEFSKNLRDWYRNNGRKLPWRETSDPYKIWLSEIILQQTRVDQGLPYYNNFVESFPTIGDFANAPLDKILRLWQGLGYYSRARNMHTAAVQVMQQFNGSFPADFESLKKLKGVGEYTAAAIASFAFHLPHPVVDGNVFRFLSRLSGSAVPIDSSLGKKVFAEMAGELFDPKHAAFIYNEIDRLPVKEKSQRCAPVIFIIFSSRLGLRLILTSERRRISGKDFMNSHLLNPIRKMLIYNMSSSLLDCPLQEMLSWEVLPAFDTYYRTRNL